MVRHAAGLVNQRRAIIAIEKARPASAPSTTRSRRGASRAADFFRSRHCRACCPGNSMRTTGLSPQAFAQDNLIDSTSSTMVARL